MTYRTRLLYCNEDCLWNSGAIPMDWREDLVSTFETSQAGRCYGCQGSLKGQPYDDWTFGFHVGFPANVEWDERTGGIPHTEYPLARRPSGQEV